MTGTLTRWIRSCSAAQESNTLPQYIALTSKLTFSDMKFSKLRERHIIVAIIFECMVGAVQIYCLLNPTPPTSSTKVTRTLSWTTEVVVAGKK
jgi:hypothetical protein